MTRPALAMDFAHPPHRGRTVGTVLVGLAAIVALVFAADYKDAQTELARWQGKLDDTRRLARRTMPALEVEAVPSREMEQEIRRANAVIDQLSLGWDALFADVESAVTPDIALLGVQPDARNRTVVLEGEARHLDALLTFLARLEATGSLQGAHLLSHEVRTADPMRPMAFKVQTAWQPPR